MSAISLSRGNLDHEARLKVGQFYTAFHRTADAEKHLISSTIWRGSPDESDFLLVNHYKTVLGMHETFKKLIETGTLERLIKYTKVPPDIKRFDVVWQSGKHLESVTSGFYLSVSERVLPTAAAADTWIKRLRAIFQELESIPGFEGCLIGKGHQTPEEILGLALWRSPHAFHDSVPDHPDYQITLYENIIDSTPRK